MLWHGATCYQVVQLAIEGPLNTYIDQRLPPLDATFTPSGDGSGARIFLVDTGISADHADFGGRASGGFASIADRRGASDCNGHGTHAAGTAAGATFGVAKSATVVPVRALDCNGSGAIPGVIAGLDWVAGQLEGSLRRQSPEAYGCLTDCQPSTLYRAAELFTWEGRHEGMG